MSSGPDAGPEPRVTPEPFDAPGVAALVDAQQAELRGRYGGVGDIGPPRDAATFRPPDGTFVVCRLEERPLACGGLCRFDATRAELKRMYVAPEARGRGLGRRILEALEDEARRLG